MRRLGIALLCVDWLVCLDQLTRGCPDGHEVIIAVSFEPSLDFSSSLARLDTVPYVCLVTDGMFFVDRPRCYLHLLPCKTGLACRPLRMQCPLRCEDMSSGQHMALSVCTSFCVDMDRRPHITDMKYIALHRLPLEDEPSASGFDLSWRLVSYLSYLDGYYMNEVDSEFKHGFS